MNQISYKDRQILVLGQYDTVVIGGGMAGTSAAISAARGKNRTLIVEKQIALGGTAVNGMVNPMMPSYVKHKRNFYEIEETLKKYQDETRDEVTGYVWSTKETMARVLEEIYTGYGGEILFDTVLVDVIVEQEKIMAVVLMTVEGLVAVKGSQFVDATGDAVLTRLSGVKVESGDEDGNNQVSSLRFEMAGIDVEKYRQFCLSLKDEFSPLVDGYYFESAMVKGKNFKLEPIFQKGVEEGVLKEEDLRYYQCFSLPLKPGCMTFNCPHIGTMKKNTSSFSRTKAIIEGRQMISRLVSFLKKYMPGFEHAYLSSEASMLGIRESYRLVGKYVLTEEDYIERARFEDAIAQGDWYIDVHSASKGLVHKDKFKKGEYYEIPYRSLVNEQIKNLIVVGRCISATFLMQASIRIQQTVIEMGDSAGKACVYGKEKNIELSDIDGKNIDDLSA